jgi:tRNA(Met) cytidine acetyltransferase
MNQSSSENSLRENNQRSLFLFNSVDNCIISLKSFLEFLLKTDISDIKGGIYLEKTFPVGDDSLEFQEILAKFPNVIEINLDDMRGNLGITLDFVVLDIRVNFSPNIIISLIETVRGGGLIVLIGLSETVWFNSVNRTYLPHTAKSYLLKWFLSRIKLTKNCYHVLDEEINFQTYFKQYTFTENLTTSVNSYPVTHDQKKIIEKLSIDLSRGKKDNKINFVIADRGRGKSAAIGLAICNLITGSSNKPARVIISSLTPRNLESFFLTIEKYAKTQNVKLVLKKRKGLIQGINFSNGSRIIYNPPTLNLKDIKCDVLIIDEAAAFPQDKLNEILNLRVKRIFLSTIHGYEGTGRSFQYKIVSQVKKRPGIRFEIHKLEIPIRYSLEDSIEKLVNQTFLLDIESPVYEGKISDIKKQHLEFAIYRNSADFFNENNILKLREIMGILMYAHYRNQPNDLLLIADSNRHFLASLEYTPESTEKQVLLAFQLAEEGNMPQEIIDKALEGVYIHGELIPTLALRQFSFGFASLRGIRIVRIAAHPDYINKGRGRIAINHLLEEFKTYDWVGVSFGASLKLIKFWRKFGFSIVQIRPNRSKETGEWNVVFLKPLSTSASKIIDQVSQDFIFQFIPLLNQSLFEMKPELAVEILRSCSSTKTYKPVITISGKYRLERYIQGHLNFLLAVDVLQELAISYFANPKQVKLSSAQELILTSRILQGRTWSQSLGKTGLSREATFGLLRKGIKKIYEASNG